MPGVIRPPVSPCVRHSITPASSALRAAMSLAAVFFAAAPLAAQTPKVLALPPDSTHWMLEGKAEVTEYLGRRCLMLDGGGATVKDFELHDGVIDMDVATPAIRGFFGLQFRVDSVNGEYVYLRQHKSGLPDAMQYTPVLNTGLNWQLYNGDGFTGAVDIPM